MCLYLRLVVTFWREIVCVNVHVGLFHFCWHVLSCYPPSPTLSLSFSVPIFCFFQTHRSHICSRTGKKRQKNEIFVCACVCVLVWVFYWVCVCVCVRVSELRACMRECVCVCASACECMWLYNASCWSEDCFYYCSERNNLVVLFRTLKVQSFILTEVSDCGCKCLCFTNTHYMYVYTCVRVSYVHIYFCIHMCLQKKLRFERKRIDCICIYIHIWIYTLTCIYIYIYVCAHIHRFHIYKYL